MEYLIRFAQSHESFRRPEIEALADLAGIDLEILFYDGSVCSLLFTLLCATIVPFGGVNCCSPEIFSPLPPPKIIHIHICLFYTTHH